MRWSEGRHATAYARSHAFSIQAPASFNPSDPHPSGVEYLLGALGADLVLGFARAAARRGILLDALEVSVSGRLNNPLLVLGVVGETGHPGFEEIAATLYVGASDADESSLHLLWEAALAASPFVHTLRRGIPSLRLEMSVVL